MDAWQQVLTVFGGNVALLAILSVLARSLLQTWLTKDAKKFETDLKAIADSKLEYLKYELKARADESLEQIKSALQVSAIEHQIRFSNLHEKRAGIIAELYSELVKVERDGRIYIYSFGKAPKNEHGEAVPLKTLQEFDSFVEEHRIYFSESICKLLTAFSTSLGPYLVHAHVYGDLGGIDRVSPEIADRRYEGFRQSIEAFRGEIPAARHELEQEFRRILGVS